MTGTERQIKATVLIAGRARGEAMLLEDTLSFWGGFDPQDGRIIDVHHPQYRQQVGDKILFVPRSRGSAGTPAGIAETLRNGSGPLALVLGERDVNIGVGVQVANRLYRLEIPVLMINEAEMGSIESGCRIEIQTDGNMTIGG